MADPVTAGDDPLWYKDAIIYQLHVKSFFDANDDGIGDFRGLMEKLDYIADLGATAIWLLPFYPSPRRDDGYDIALYEGVSPDYGTMEEARRFIEEAHRRGLRVITELVINHTSDQHPWFQAARHAPKGSPERNLYVWADDDKGYPGVPIVFCDVEKSNWTWDEVAGQFFWHRFYSHQPDLNFDNPEVLERVLKVMRFWLDIGVDGLRLDAVPYLVEREGTDCANLPETHEVLRKIRAQLDAHYTGRMFLAEANLWPEDTQQYFGAHADECHMAFNFPLMPRMYMAIAREDRFPITDILRQTPEIPETCQWAIFLRNHDELTLETVTDAERDYLWNVYAADRRARINLGIRRRLAPLLERDRRRIELMNALLLTLPGTPVIYYGDEIGMGDNIHLGDRDGVRTPMQWSPDRNGGFSKADPQSLVLPVIQDPLYGFAALNVEAQLRDAHSLLNWTRRMLAMRRQHPAFGRGSFQLLFPGNRRILAYLRAHEGETLLCVANLAHTLQAVELSLGEFEHAVPVDLLGGTAFPPVGRAPYVLTLPPFGFYAFRLSRHAAKPDWHEAPPEMLPDFATLVIRDGLMDALSERHRAQIETEALPAYLARRRWFPGVNEVPERVRLGWVMPLPGTRREVALAEIEAWMAGEPEGSHERFLMPLCLVHEDENPPPVALQLALTRVRRGRRVGYLTDAACLDGLPRAMLDALSDGRTIALPDGAEVRFSPTARLAAVSVSDHAPMETRDTRQPGTLLAMTDEVVLKVFRHIAPRRSGEAEMARHLTAKGFAFTPPLLGEVTHVAGDGTRAPLVLMFAAVRNQGDALAWTANQLRRALDAAASVPDDGEHRFTEETSGLIPLMRSIGRRLAEMHGVLAEASDDPAFAPQEMEAAGARRWGETAAARLSAALARLGEEQALCPPEAADAVERLGHIAPDLSRRLVQVGERAAGSLALRIHGDFGLDQVLVAADDVFIVGFSGARPGRSARTTPWRDVADALVSVRRAAALVALDPCETAAASEPLRRAALIAQFRARAERTLLAGYLERAPAGLAERALVDVFLVDALCAAVPQASAAQRLSVLEGLCDAAERLTGSRPENDAP